MGANCCVAREGGDRESDLPAPDLTQKNEYQKFELSLPFARTYIDTFIKRVKGASFIAKRAKPGSDGTTVTLTSLRQTFLSPAWEDLQTDDSRITKVINSSIFKNEKGEIDANKLILFGFLNCAGDFKHKSVALYGILQEGGESQHTFLSASDKDIVPTITKLIKLCTSELAQLMFEVDRVAPSEVQGKVKEIDGTAESIIDENYLDPIFDHNSKLQYEEWVEESKKPQITKVFYEVNNLRNLIFTKAGISFAESQQF